MKSKLSLVVFALVVFPVLVFAQQEEITLTTYYPSPFGSYNQMDAHHLNIVSNDAKYGTLNFGGLRTDSVPSIGTDGVAEGSIYYNKSSHQFLALDQNNNWRPFGGGLATPFSLIYCPGATTGACIAVPAGGQLDGTITGNETCSSKCQAQGGICVSGFPYAISSQYPSPPSSSMGAVPEAPFDCDARGANLTSWTWGIGCRCLR